MSSQKKLLVKDVTIGADIEIFLKEISSNKVISAEGIIKGTKDAPFRFKEGDDYFGTSLDNVMAEFCIPPAVSDKQFYKNIQEALSYIKTIIPKDIDILIHPSAKLDQKYLQTDSAKLFGCEPDYNVWNNSAENPMPSASGGIRTCGGHIHIGYKKPTWLTNTFLVMAMDIFVGVPMVLIEPTNVRKNLYGRAGAYRVKPYGIEYRTVSNYYASSEALTKWAYNNTLKAIEFVNSGFSLSESEKQQILFTINYNNINMAKDVCNHFGVQLP